MTSPRFITHNSATELDSQIIPTGKYPHLNPYLYCAANPIMFIDPTGQSTHTALDGIIVAVYDDDDLGVYLHDATIEEVQEMLRTGYSTDNKSAGGKRMGETYFWDEFVNPETGQTLTDIKIQFGTSFDSIIDEYHEISESMNLIGIAQESKPGGLFDIKAKYKNVGSMLNGKYVTARSAGNYLAGYNARHGSYLGYHVSFDKFQQLSGALHIESSAGKSLSKYQMGSIVLNGYYLNCSNSKAFTFPYWGELPYQYRMSKMGWNYKK